jgi:hypothetical protein
MSQQSEVPIYQAFLLRCWPLSTDATDRPTAWRFELQEVSVDSAKHRFNDLEQVCAFVATKLNAAAVDNEPDSSFPLD